MAEVVVVDVDDENDSGGDSTSAGKPRRRLGCGVGTVLAKPGKTRKTTMTGIQHRPSRPATASSPSVRGRRPAQLDDRRTPARPHANMEAVAAQAWHGTAQSGHDCSLGVPLVRAAAAEGSSDVRLASATSLAIPDADDAAVAERNTAWQRCSRTGAAVVGGTDCWPAVAAGAAASCRTRLLGDHADAAVVAACALQCIALRLVEESPLAAVHDGSTSLARAAGAGAKGHATVGDESTPHPAEQATSARA